jgi:hypothetical protein
MGDRFSEWAKQSAKDPGRAPWSGQRVSLVARIGAGFLVLCFLGAAIYVAAPYVGGSRPIDPSLQEIASTVLFAYGIALFTRVAITGQAPGGWLPWK